MRRFAALLAALSLASAQAKTDLQVVWFTEAPAEQTIFDKYVLMYEKANPDVDVSVTYVPFQQLTQKLQLMVAGKTPPDVARVVTANIAEFDPVASDLGKYTNGTTFANQFLSSQVPYIKKGNRVIGAPLDVTANGLFYNKDCFREAKVAVPTNPLRPWTWAQWRQALETVTKNSKCRFGLSFDYTTLRFSTMLYQAGGRYLDASGKKMAVNTPQSERAIDFFADMVKDGLIPRSQWLSGEDPSSLFKSGLSAMYMSGNWNLTQLSQVKNFQWGVAPLPKDKIRSTVPGGKFLMGFKDSRNPAEGAKFIQWLTGKDINIAFSKDNMTLSARKDARGVKYGTFDDEIAIYQSDLSITPSYVGRDWSNPAMAKINTFIRDQIVKVLLGQQTSKQALEAITAEGNKNLK
ncbi:sugar ABC transporter substrate-binding protein [Deinococcus sp. YIM 134068]|uniref:ABC transporter substrate-binding protein n=1 Tax=Deinococcus lichenicola TaxID=3118910 RepID=UPI002F930D62